MRFFSSTLKICVLMTFLSSASWLSAQKMTTPIQIKRGYTDLSYLGQSIDKMISDFMTEKNIPGLTLAIVQAPYIPRISSYGITDISAEGEKLASTHTLWNAGLIAQAYAAIAIFQLYEAKKLDIKAPISKYLNTIPKEWKSVSVFQLLQHATGIADYTKVPDFDYTKSYTANELIALVKDKPLAFTSGTNVAKSATNFLLAALIVEKVSKITYEDFVTENQIKRLHLQHTYFIEQLSSLPSEEISNTKLHQKFLSDARYIHPTEYATGYKEKDGQLISVPNIPVGSAAFKGYADIWASAGDISMWDIGLAGELLVKEPANRALIYKPTQLENGLTVPAMAGWEFTKHKGFLDIEGSGPGFSAYLARFTDKRDLLCVTLMGNKEGIDFTNLARKISAAYEKSLIAENISNDLYVKESIFDAPTTVARIKANLQQKKVPIFADFDHEKNAKEVNLPLKSAQVIVFGSPAVGTKLMQLNPAIAIELPLKLLVWEDDKGRVWVAFKDLHKLAEKYQIQHPVVGKIQAFMEQFVNETSSLLKAQ